MEHTEIRETVKESEKNNFDFTPKTDEEQKHLVRMQTVYAEKRKSDWLLVGEIIGISPENARKAFSRVYSSYHVQAIEALETIIENRKSLLTKKS
ncbi:MAG: hypothetical protein EOO42_04375 [Flavobacteriales bacterium]|nr:MAG: hypothetical protein EOO42_04375 [Flavobacteriales bacterium]